MAIASIIASAARAAASSSSTARGLLRQAATIPLTSHRQTPALIVALNPKIQHSQNTYASRHVGSSCNIHSLASVPRDATMPKETRTIHAGIEDDQDNTSTLNIINNLVDENDMMEVDGSHVTFRSNSGTTTFLFLKGR